MPILLDLKSAHATHLLGTWFRGRRDTADFAACTENLPWLIQLRFAAPSVARWPSYPDIGERRTHHVQRVVAGLWRSHCEPQRAAPRRSGRPSRGDAAAPRSAREPDPARRPALARAAARRTSARRRPTPRRQGLCVHHWVVSEAAGRAGARASACTSTPGPSTTRSPLGWRPSSGVDSITTDRVDLVRLALRSQPRPGPGTASSGRRQGGGAYRAAVIRPRVDLDGPRRALLGARRRQRRCRWTTTRLEQVGEDVTVRARHQRRALRGQPLQHRRRAAALVEGVERRHRQVVVPRQRKDGGDAAQRRAGVDDRRRSPAIERAAGAPPGRSPGRTGGAGRRRGARRSRSPACAWRTTWISCAAIASTPGATPRPTPSRHCLLGVARCGAARARRARRR